MAIDTAKVTGRRTLRFGSVDEAMADAERLAAAHRGGGLQQVGNWSLGQALGHLAVWAEYSFAPIPLKTPFFIKWILGFQKKKFLNGPMKAGVKIPRVEGGTLGTDPMPLDEALERFRRAFDRLRREAPTHPSPIFDLLTQDEAIALNLRHAELHLSFFNDR